MAARAQCRYESVLTSVLPRKDALVLVLTTKAVVFSSKFVRALSVPVAQGTCSAQESVDTPVRAKKDMRATAKAARMLTSVRGKRAYSTFLNLNAIELDT